MAEFQHFNLTDVTYKTVEDHNIDLTIFTSKDLKPGTYPLIVRFHGGFLITGSRMYHDWFPKWLLQWAQRNPAILISADYRLLPEAHGTDILSDISDLFTWIKSSLPATLSTISSEIKVDLTSILTVGESAGGYLAVQSALLQPQNSGIKAVISTYGVLDIKTRFFMEEYEKIILGAPMVEGKLLDEQRAAVKEGKAPKHVSNVDPPARAPLAMSIVQQGRYLEILGEETELYPMDNLERAEALPPIWLCHGSEDSAVPVEGSRNFATKAKELHPNANIKLTIEPGEHGFDADATLETLWLKEGLQWVTTFWR